MIRFGCQCGKQYTAKDELAGRMVTCKHCGSQVRIPDKGPDDSSQDKQPVAQAPQQAAGGDAAKPDTADHVSPEKPRHRLKWTVLAAAGIVVLIGLALYVHHTIRQDEIAAAHRRNVSMYETCLADAKAAIGRKDIPAAVTNLQTALSLPEDVNKGEAALLLKEAQVAQAPPEPVLRSLSDAEFQTLCETKALPPSRRLSCEPLNVIYADRLLAGRSTEQARRKAAAAEAERVAQAERERLAKEAAERKEREAKAEAERRKREAEERAAQFIKAEADRREQEAKRLANIKTRVSGGAWLTKQDGNANTIRGLKIYALRSPATNKQFKEMLQELIDAYSIVLQVAKEDAKSNDKGSTEATLVSLLTGRITDWQSRKKSVSSSPADGRVDLIEFYNPIPRWISTGEEVKPWLDICRQQLVGSTSTDVEGKFNMDLTGGDYRLYAEFETKHSKVVWLVPVKVIEPGNLVVNSLLSKIPDSTSCVVCAIRRFRRDEAAARDEVGRNAVQDIDSGKKAA